MLGETMARSNVMDPDKALEEIRDLCVAIRTLRDDPKSFGDCSCEADELVEYIEALDQWLSGKGFLPKDWNR